MGVLGKRCSLKFLKPCGHKNRAGILVAVHRNNRKNGILELFTVHAASMTDTLVAQKYMLLQPLRWTCMGVLAFAIV
jgi:hypothetical protein